MTFDVRRGADRFTTVQPGISSRHCFSSGAHYDPDNTGFGPLLVCDEHEVQPSHGFAPHRHAGTTIVSWPISGSLRHQDDADQITEVGPGWVQVLSTGAGVGHAEYAGGDEPVHFVQMSLLAEPGAPGGYRRERIPPGELAPVLAVATAAGPATLGVARPSLARPSLARPVLVAAHPRQFVLLTRGAVTVTAAGHDAVLAPGDSVRIRDAGRLELTAMPTSAGPAEVVIWNLPG